MIGNVKWLTPEGERMCMEICEISAPCYWA